MTVQYSATSLLQIIEISTYLRIHFSVKEVEKFITMIEEFEIAVRKFPKAYMAISSDGNTRKAVINRNCSIIYELSKEYIRVLAVLDNRQDPEYLI